MRKNIIITSFFVFGLVLFLAKYYNEFGTNNLESTYNCEGIEVYEGEIISLYTGSLPEEISVKTLCPNYKYTLVNNSDKFFDIDSRGSPDIELFSSGSSSTEIRELILKSDKISGGTDVYPKYLLREGKIFKYDYTKGRELVEVDSSLPIITPDSVYKEEDELNIIYANETSGDELNFYLPYSYEGGEVSYIKGIVQVK